MATYRVAFARSARKELERLNDPLRSRVLRRIERLASSPRPVGCQKLEGAEDLWRIRIADYRVIYSIDDSRGIVDVSAVRHRSEAYR
jgi:mRNA interferase RelE/StbE